VPPPVPGRIWTPPAIGGIMRSVGFNRGATALGLGVVWVATAWLGVGTPAGQPNDRPLPDEATFLAAARAKLASDERLQARYTYKLRRTELHRNPFGRIGTGDVSLYEVYPSPIAPLTYYRLVATNGVPTPPAALAEQDRRQREKLDAYIARLRRLSPEERARRLEADSVVGARERAMVDDVVAALDYRLERRETVGGRPTIVVAFAPKASARPRTREGEIVRHFKGWVWVDEAEHQVVRVEAEAIRAIAFGFGVIVRIDQGTRGVFRREPVADGTWLPAEARLVGGGRALLFRRFGLDLVSEYFDYRPIDPAAPPSFVALPRDLLGGS
jgi:hypothetical protein